MTRVTLSRRISRLTALAAACLVAVLGGVWAQSASAAITSCPGLGATFAGGSGTTADPYQVATADQLAAIQGKYLQCSFEQTAAISLAGRRWTPIGPGWGTATAFTGEFDGGGHAITDMTIVADGTPLPPYSLGLFGQLISARVSGVDVSGSITATDVATLMPLGNVGYTGGLAGRVPEASPGTVISDVRTNVHIDVVASFGNVPQTWTPSCMCSEIVSVGGLVGSIGPGTVVSAAQAHGDVSVTSQCDPLHNCYLNSIGGLVGSNSDFYGGPPTSTLEQVSATGAVSATLTCTAAGAQMGSCLVYDVGGLMGGGVGAGSIQGPTAVTDASATGPVSVTCAGLCTKAVEVGGLVGEGDNLTILRARTAGTVMVSCPNGVTGSAPCATSTGGLVGRVNGGSITQSFAPNTTSVVGNLQAGGLLGMSQGAWVTDAFARSPVEPSDSGVFTSAGGLVGALQNSAVVQRSYATGNVNTGTPATGVGGLVGSVASGASATTNAIWNTTSTGQSTSAGGGTAQATAQMTDPVTYGVAGFGWPIVEGWQRPTPITTWGICAPANAGYPFLLWAYTSSPCAPDAPIAVTALPGSNQATVRWVAPVNEGGSPITSYLAEVSTGSPTCTATPPVTSCTITGLSNGTTYNVQVRAVNANGAGPWSATASVTPAPAARPGAPTAVTASVPAGTPGAVDVAWTAPVDVGAGATAITSYTATASPGGATCTSNTGSPVTPSCQVTGLTDGTQYTFTVTALNNASTPASSLSSVPSNAVRPGGWTVPGAPTAVTGTAGDTVVDVAWAAPADPGGAGAVITGYTATASPGGQTCDTAGTVLSCRVVGLDDGTAYTFRVTATNVVGTGAASAASSPVTPRLDTVPDPPQGTSAAPADAGATVSWDAPVDDGGSPITAYAVAATPGPATCRAATGTTSCAVTGLTNGTAYTFTVTAANALGTSSASGPTDPVTPSAPSPPVVPSAPRTVTATAGSTQATVRWSPPVSDGGAAINAYAVTATPGGRTCTVAATASTCAVTGLTNGTAYTFTVTAANAVGTSAPSAPSAPVTPTAPLGTVSGTRRTTAAGAARITATLTAGRTGSYAVMLVRSNGRAQPLLAGSRVGGVRTTPATTTSVTVRMSAGHRYPLALRVARSAPKALSVRLTYTQPPAPARKQTIPLATGTATAAR